MRRFAFLALLVTLACGTSAWSAAPAAAQIHEGDLRISVDADMLSVAGVKVGSAKDTMVSFGPNQLGGSRISSTAALPTPLGLGLAYALQPKVLLGARVGLGYDVVSPSGATTNTRYLGISIMPEVTFVPLGEKAKLFLSFAPIFQASRAKEDPGKQRTLLGGFGLGVGTFIFVANNFSVDLGFHFEGRFGNAKLEPNRGSTSVQDLRGLVRLGISFWT